jgi:hypothetical protein
MWVDDARCMVGQLNHDANALAVDAAKTIDNVLEAPRRADTRMERVYEVS